MDLLTAASEGKLALFIRFDNTPGYACQLDELRDPETGEIALPSSGYAPELSEQFDAVGVLALGPDDAINVAHGLLAGRPDVTVIMFETGRRLGDVFVPDSPVDLTQERIEVSKAEVQIFRQAIAASMTSERIEGARALHLASIAPAPAPTRSGKYAQKRLSEALDAYTKLKLRQVIRSAAEVKRVRDGCSLLVELVGDLTMGEVDAERLRQFRDEKLSQVPADENKVRLKFKTTSVSASIAAVVGHDWPIMSAGQRNLRMAWIRGWFRWLKAQNWVTDDPGVALDGESVLTAAQARSERLRDDEKRDVFGSEHLQRMFAAPWFKTGICAAAGVPADYWLPLLGAYTGARISELCQLHLGDLGQAEDGTWFIDFNERTIDKRLKSLESARKIPVHPALLDLGLARWHATLKAAGFQRLFPELIHSGDKGYSKASVKWFSTFMKELGYARDGTLVFHSFRHTFTNALPGDAPERLGNQLTGHMRGGSVRARTYQKDVEPGDALAYVERLSIKLPQIAAFDVEYGIKAVRKALGRKVGNRKGKEDMGPLGIA